MPLSPLHGGGEKIAVTMYAADRATKTALVASLRRQARTVLHQPARFCQGASWPYGALPHKGLERRRTQMLPAAYDITDKGACHCAWDFSCSRDFRGRQGTSDG